MIEFSGTRAECFAQLGSLGFGYQPGHGWVKPGWLAIVVHQNHGDFVAEVQGWNGPGFTMRAWQTSSD